MTITFDGSTKIISLSATSSLSVKDLWSRWCDWMAISTNSKWLPAMSQVGGNTIDLSAGTSIPPYIYLINDWRVRPQESSHTLNVSDGILLVDGGGDPFVDTLGSYIVRINYSQPVQAITVATGGGSGASAAEVWGYSTRALTSGAAPSASAIAAQVRVELAVELARIDAAISSIASSNAPSAIDNALAVRSELATELARLDAAISSRLASGIVNANVQQVNGTTIYGTGTDLDPFREVP